ncbi:hypothetical protein SK128_017216 [Halocaridina rubra]|uniref:NHR domain-containing protein n=1 Tax=Halocaridina rubra TaxID=373956 RepID=A0AAN8XAH0_HALRR
MSVGSEVLHHFSKCCGANIALSNNNTVATRIRHFNHGLVFTSHPLEAEELFEFEKPHDLGDLHRIIESLADKVRILEADPEEVKALQHKPQLPNNASARVTAQIYIRIPGNPFEREICNILTNQGIPSEEVLIKELSRKPNWVSFAITISKGFENVPYKLNQWSTGTIVQPFCGGK